MTASFKGIAGLQPPPDMTGEGSASTLTHVVVGMVQFLVGCWPAARLIPCHVVLSIGWLTMWQFVSLEQNKPRARGRDSERKTAVTAFYS